MAEYPERCHKARSKSPKTEPFTIAITTAIIPATPTTDSTSRYTATNANT